MGCLDRMYIFVKPQYPQASLTASADPSAKLCMHTISNYQYTVWKLARTAWLSIIEIAGLAFMHPDQSLRTEKPSEGSIYT